MPMRRRRVLALAAAGLSGLAGCTDSGESPTGTPTDEPTPTATNTPAATATSTETDTPTETASPTPAFDPRVTYPSCQVVEVEAPAYDKVVVYGQEEYTVFDAGYSGAREFKGPGAIRHTVVRWRDRSVDVANPADACFATPTEAPETPTATPGPRQSIHLEGQRINQDPYRVRATVENYNDYAVQVRIKITYTHDETPIGSNERTHTIDAGWEWETTFEYDGVRDPNGYSLKLQHAERTSE